MSLDQGNHHMYLGRCFGREYASHLNLRVSIMNRLTYMPKLVAQL